eukprot:scaffold29461_cov27-Tisochrysis_lutea.AAC.1
MPLRLSLTLPERWMEGKGEKVARLRKPFIEAYRRKWPGSRLATAAEDEWGFAIKDESLLLFSKKRLQDDENICEALYDRQEVSVMAEWDWEDHARSLAELRKAVVDELAVTMRHVLHEPSSIVPVTSRAQIQPGNTYVLLTGWYKQQCVIVTPEHTVADLKSYLHAKNGVRMPMESIDIGLRTADDQIEILDPAATLQQVYEKSMDGTSTATPATALTVSERKRTSGAPPEFHAAAAFEGARPGLVFKLGPQGLGYYSDERSRARASKGNGEGAGANGADADGGAVVSAAEHTAADARASVDAARVALAEAEADLRDGVQLGMPERLRLALERRRDERAEWLRQLEAAGTPREGVELVQETLDKLRVSDSGANNDQSNPAIEDVPEVDTAGGAAQEGGAAAGGAPSFLGRAMVLGVGKRVQDRKHQIWLPSVHDPWSFRTPDDKQPTGGTTHAAALPAPRGWTAPAETQPMVNSDDACSIM